MSTGGPLLPSRLTILHAYRHLLRAGLIAVQYSVPARYAIRDKLRKSFRERPPISFNQTRIDNTLEFLRAAGEHVGIEHRVVRNLCFVHYWQNNSRFRRFIEAARLGLTPATYQSYDETLRLLNESAELDLV
ncbi:hypothetical protein EV426DRAFT_577446 [Tirmania nivea]|nr:hypothetical protein EV426DRAFT_577446 [Tirmania nivea]